MSSPHLNPYELAARLNVTPETLANWRISGAGPRFVKVHRRKVLYPVKEVEAWEASRLQRSTVG